VVHAVCRRPALVDRYAGPLAVHAFCLHLILQRYV
jgi:hypothetical protein